MNNYFIQYQKDIFQAYINLNKSIEYKGISENFNKQLSPLIVEILSSYYFEESFKPELLINEGHNEIKFNSKIMFTPFIDIIDFYKFKDKKSPEINIEDIKKSLINIDPFYSIIFETDKLKQQINLINKYEIQYSIVEVGENDIYKNIKPFHEKRINENSFYNKKNSQFILENELKKVFDIKFINFNNNKNRHFVIAHNHNQIVGLTSLTKYSKLFINEENHFMKNKFIYNSYVSVAKQFRGHNIAIEMVKKAIEFIKENNFIFIRSSPTENGKDYIEEKINNLTVNDKDLICINNGSNKVLSDLQKVIHSIKNEKDYSKFTNEFKSLTHKLNSHFIERENQLIKIEDFSDCNDYIKKSDYLYNKEIDTFKSKFETKKNLLKI